MPTKVKGEGMLKKRFTTVRRSNLIAFPEWARYGADIMKEPWSFYTKHAKDYGDWEYTPGVKRFQEAEKEFLIRHVQLGARVIDIGCGPGEHLTAILDRQAVVTAVDFVPEMIDIAKRKVGDDVQFICSDVVDLSFPENYFDYGVCYCTLPNQKDYQDVFDRIGFYCKSLIISVYNWNERFELADFYSRNGLRPKIDEDKRTIFLSDGMRYIFIPEGTVKEMYERNKYDLSINEYGFGNIYYGEKKE